MHVIFGTLGHDGKAGDLSGLFAPLQFGNITDVLSFWGNYQNYHTPSNMLVCTHCTDCQAAGFNRLAQSMQQYLLSPLLVQLPGRRQPLQCASQRCAGASRGHPHLSGAATHGGGTARGLTGGVALPMLG